MMKEHYLKFPSMVLGSPVRILKEIAKNNLILEFEKIYFFIQYF